MTSRLLSIVLVAAALTELLAGTALAQQPPAPPAPTDEGENPRPRRTRRPRPGALPEVVPAPTATPPPPTTPTVVQPATPGAPPAVIVPGPGGTNVPGTAAAPPNTPPLPSGEAPGEDADLYKCRQFKPGAKIKFAFKPDTDMKELVVWVMGFTCKSFIFGNAISGRAAKVTIIAPSEMTPEDAYRLFLVALQTMNLTVVPKGHSLEIVESNRARETPLPVYKSGASVPGQDQIVRVVLRPEHISVDELTAVVNAMKTSTGVVSPIPSAGAIILTDYGSIIDKLMDVMKEVDAPTGTEKIYIIYLQNADAQDIANKLSDIFGIGRGGAAAAPGMPQVPNPRRPQVPGAPVTTTAGGSRGGGGSSTPSKIIADTRTNSLIVIASERAYQRILALVKRLDFAAGGEATGTIHVYALSNADAEQLAGTMNTLITGVAPQRPAGQGGVQRPVNVPAAAQQQGAVGAGTGAFEGQIKLTHDKPTNSLVIVSSPKDFYSLRDVIRKLDKPRRQVFVEATIAEISLDKTRELGVSYHGGVQFDLKNSNDSTAFAGVESLPLSSINPLSAATLGGLVGGAIGPQIPGLSIPSIGVLFQLLQSNNEVNVLSTPNILTTDNEAAEISVGQNIPFQSSSIGNQLSQLAGAAGTNTNTGVNPLLGLGGFGQQISRQDVALTLKLTPHISESDFVRLEVDLEISDILSENFGGNGPSWSKRRVKTPIVVRDQQPVVIGGLMADRVTIRETKVPLLGDIPLLGYLFKYQKKQKVKTNLLVFLTPYVIKDQADIQRIFEQKVNERREFVRAFSTFEEHEFDVRMDYRRKKGLLEDINRAILSADEDDRLMKEAEQSRQRLGEEGPVEMPGDVGGPDTDNGAPEMPPNGTVPPPPPPPPEGE